jgi:hypothetical protein
MGNPNVRTNPSTGVLIDRSQSLTTDQFVTVALENASRSYFLFQNISNSTMWLNIGGVATADNDSIYVAPQGSVIFNGSFVPSGIVNVICPAAADDIFGRKFVAKEGIR